MREKPLISVLMGIYNCADTLEEAIECIIKQTYDNWELIMCDDCSQDHTLEVAETIAKKDKRIRVIRNDTNRTLAPTLNHCLQCARGKYVARMDGDDACSLDRFEKEVGFLEEHSEFALVSCHMNLYDSDGIYRVVKHKSVPEARDLLYRSQFCHAGCMMRTSVMKELGGYSEGENCKRVEDYDLWVRLYAAGYKGYNIQETLYAMRDDRNAVKRRSFRNRLNEAKLKIRIVNTFALSKRYYLYACVPILKAIVSTSMYRYAHKNKDS